MNPQRPEYKEIAGVVEQIADRFRGSDFDQSVSKELLERHAKRMVNDYVQGPASRYKAIAVNNVLSKSQVEEIVDFYRSPLGIKHYALRQLMDSLDFNEASERLNLTVKEQRELGELQENGVIKLINDNDQLIWYAYADSTRNYFRRFNKQLSKALSVDPYLFAYPRSLELESAEDKQVRNRSEVADLLEAKDEPGSSSATNSDDVQKALRIQMALKIPNSAKPCDQYLTGWGSTVSQIKGAAEALGLTYQRDSTYGSDTYIVYKEGTFVVDKQQGYYKIERRIRFTPDELLAMSSIKQAVDASFIKNWSVLDASKYTGYGNCKNGEENTIVHARVMMNGEQTFYVERLIKTE
jgi:hypothetical protein